MLIGKDYIRKQLYWFALILLGIAAAEMVVLLVLKPAPFIQVFLQVVFGVFFIAVLIRTAYHIWTVWEYNRHADESD